MEPIDELSKALTGLLEDIVAKRYDLDIEGQKLILDALRKLLQSTKTLNTQLQSLESQVLEKHRGAGRSTRPKLFLVK